MRQRIQKLLDDEVNPMVSSHGGHIELVDYANRTAFIKMSGGCQGCASSKATLVNGVEAAIFKAFPRVKRVVDVTDHEAGENPYYQ
ncbi:MAG: NifU family protein [Myxococcales bacterium]|nr:NifU family protein [Myxococcales bacterium]